MDGERLRVEARLVDAVKDRKIWVDDFAGTLSDIPDLSRRIATAVGPIGRTVAKPLVRAHRREARLINDTLHDGPEDAKTAKNPA